MRRLILYMAISSCFVAVIAAAGMDQYCQSPPFIKQATKPNLLLMLDNSASMYDLAYNSNATSFCYDDGTSFSSSNTYAGYFDPTKKYVYSKTPSVNISFPDPATDMFVETTTVPASCDYSSGTSPAYNVCIKKSGAQITTFYATGNFLNWLSASKLDIQKQVLTGGKYEASSGVLVGESRGCNGRRFVKTLPGMGITFAVRGPNALAEDNNYNPSTQGGASRIEVYLTQNANIAQCQSAITNWSGGSYGSAQTDTKGCLDGGPVDATNNQLNQLNQSMQDCWKIDDNITKLKAAGTTPTQANVFQGVNINSSTNNCEQIYKDLCGNISGSADTCANTGQMPSNSLAAIAQENASYWQCTNNASHLPPTAGYDVYGSDAVGFIGRCATISLDTNHKLQVVWNTNCAYEEVLHYCYAKSAAEVTDPSAGGSVTYQNSGNLPAILMDSSVLTLGAPAGTFFVRAQQPLDASSNRIVPTGLVQQFSTKIRFGTMAFNDIGNASETTTVPGTVTGNLDGSKILSYITESVGDHSTGLIQSIDNLRATTWTPFAEAYYNAIGYFANNSDLRINTTDFDVTQNPSQYYCQTNNVLLISEGQSTADQAAKVGQLADLYNTAPAPYGSGTSAKCSYFAGSKNLDFLAWIAKNTKIQTINTTLASPTPPVKENESITTYVVYTGKPGTTGTDECDPYTLMSTTATKGGTTLQNASTPADLRTAITNIFHDIGSQSSSGTAVSVLSSSSGSGANLLQALFYPKRSFGNTDITWTSDLMNYWYYFDPFFTYMQIREDNIREGGSAYTLLDLSKDSITSFVYDSSSKTTSAVRYPPGSPDPRVKSGTATLVPMEEAIPIWRAGFNLWWTDPTARKIYTPVSSPTLSLEEFTIANVADFKDTLGQSGDADAKATINYIRGYDYAFNATVPAAQGNPGESCSQGAANCDPIGRNRTVTSGYCTAGKSPCKTNGDCSARIANDTCTLTEAHVWKLGDILSATPRIMGPTPLNTFNLSAPYGYSDKTYSDFILSDDYKDRHLVFVSANDGMLHAFNLGKLLQKWTGQAWTQVAKLEGGTEAGGIGTESYAFIPKNVLPYLKYLHDTNYCHIYSADGPITLTDAAINKPSSCSATDYWNCPRLTTMSKVCSASTSTSCNSNSDCPPNGGTCTGRSNNVDFDKTSWRTLLIGSMGLGGATCDGTASADPDRISSPVTLTKVCSASTSTACSSDTDCLPNGGTCSKRPVGWSSYFALDVTDQATPRLLWEFSNPDLGVTNVGPAIVRVNGDGNKRCSNNSQQTCSSASDCTGTPTPQCITTNTTNGKWFAVLASGATGPISKLSPTDPAEAQVFMGTSDKTLKLFVIDLQSGALVRTIDNSTITNAFAGSLSTGPIELQRANPNNNGNYQDDAVYIGYVQQNANSTDTPKPFNKGGVLRLVTNNDTDPNNWTVSQLFRDFELGPVTSSVANLFDRVKGKLWLYFAEGRYFYKTDDPTEQRKLIGVMDPCYSGTTNSIDTSLAGCTPLGVSDLQNQSTPSASLTAGKEGWYILLNNADAASLINAERVISNPTPDTRGGIYFLSVAPKNDVCSFGGTSYFWAIDYQTGGPVTYQMKGKALVQVSTGEIREMNLADVFTNTPDPRKSDGFEGIPPAGTNMTITNEPTAMKKFMHVQER